LVTPLALSWWAWVMLRLRLFRRPREVHPRHVLLVAWDFPPAASTGVNVPASFVRHAARAGWRVTVVCAPCAARPTDAGRALAASIPDEVSVFRVPRWLATERRVRLHPAWGIPAIDGSYLGALALAVTALKRLRGPAPFLVLASGPPFSNFVAARWLARAFRAKLALQYRDEWTVNTPAFVGAAPGDAVRESRCLAEADLVTFVSKGKEALYRKAFPDLDPAKCVTVPNGWEPYFHALARRETHHLPKDAFTITYTGRWHVSLAPLLEVFADVLAKWPRERPTLQLVFVGAQLPGNERLIAAFRARHPAHVLSLPATSQTVAIEIQRESSCLLLINDHLYDGVVPLKTFDYMCGERPVLVFGCTGGAADIVESHGAGLAVGVSDSAEFAAALEHFIVNPRTYLTPARRAWSEAHSRAVLVPQLLRAMAALSGAAPAAAAPTAEAVLSAEDPCLQMGVSSGDTRFRSTHRRAHAHVLDLD
jgi:glycosyltransferase involved in cell wall biosynthesis